MAMIKCPECGQEVSDKSKSCVHCGAPIKKRKLLVPSKVRHHFSKRDILKIVWFLGVICFIAYIILNHYNYYNDTTIHYITVYRVGRLYWMVSLNIVSIVLLLVGVVDIVVSIIQNKEIKSRIIKSVFGIASVTAIVLSSIGMVKTFDYIRENNKMTKIKAIVREAYDRSKNGTTDKFFQGTYSIYSEKLDGYKFTVALDQYQSLESYLYLENYVLVININLINWWNFQENFDCSGCICTKTPFTATREYEDGNPNNPYIDYWGTDYCGFDFKIKNDFKEGTSIYFYDYHEYLKNIYSFNQSAIEKNSATIVNIMLEKYDALLVSIGHDISEIGFTAY